MPAARGGGAALAVQRHRLGRRVRASRRGRPRGADPTRVRARATAACARARSGSRCSCRRRPRRRATRRSTSPRCARAGSQPGRVAIVGERHAEGRLPTATAASAFSRLARPGERRGRATPRPRASPRRARWPSRPRSSTCIGCTSAVADRPEGDHAAGEARARAHHPRIVRRWRPRDGVRRRAFEDSRPSPSAICVLASRSTRCARCRRWSTRGRPARRSPPGRGSRRRGSSRVRRRPPRRHAAGRAATAAGRCGCCRFAAVAHRAEASPTAASPPASLVVVLPALPVMATTFAPDSRRTYARDAPAAPSRCRSTSTTGTAVGGSSGRHAAVAARRARSRPSSSASPGTRVRLGGPCDGEERVARLERARVDARRGSTARIASPAMTRPPHCRRTAPR